MIEGFILLLKIMLINIVLSGDNAIVIAMASKSLPLNERKKAIWWGAFGAVALRLILTVVAITLLKVPYIQVIGSLFLIYIAIKLLVEENGHSNVKQAATLFGAIRTIVIADFIMSLDNVLAIAAVARGNLLLMTIGIAMSIPLIIWGSTAIMKLLNRFPIFVYIGAAILGYTAGEMCMNDKKMHHYVTDIWHVPHSVIPIGATVFVIASSLLLNYRRKRHVVVK